MTLIITLGAFVMVVYIRKFVHMERMTIIDKGLSPDLFKKDRRNSPSPVLRFGLLLVGAGLGLLVGYILDETFYMGVAAYFSMLMVWGGIGLLVAYLVEERKARRAD